MNDAPSPAPRPRGRARQWWVPLVGALLIVAWQSSFTGASHDARREWAMSASMGLSGDAPYFFYFFHHFGVFPVAALDVPRLGPSKQAAEAFVAKHGDRLRMDLDWPTSTPRFGDYGKLFMFVPDVWLRGDPVHPTATPFNHWLFVLALVSVFAAFWAENHLLLGTLVVLLVGSDPFQVLETYGRGNVFSLPISVTLLAMAAHLRFLSGRRWRGAAPWLVVAASGILLASVREIRAEAALVSASVLATCLFAGGSLPRRAGLAIVFVLAMGLTGRAWSAYWNHEFENAERFVARAGGHVFRPPLGTHHAFWHAMYCGLGDFGGDHGYRWDDREAFRWATTRDPVTNPRPIPYHYDDGYFFRETYPSGDPIAPTDVPEYNALVRHRVLSDVRAHPAWYAGILGKRLFANLGEATPASLAFGAFTFGVPGVGWLLPIVLLFALARRRTFHAGVIAFALPLSAVAMVVYSGKSTIHYGVSHLIALAVAADLLVRMRRSAPSERQADVT